jgi:uncharacterized protein HemX
MSKDGKDTQVENETYHYPNEEPSEAEIIKSPASNASRSKASSGNSIMNFLSRHKRVVFIVLIFIVVFISFKWMKSTERKQMASNLKETTVSQSAPKTYSTAMKSNEDHSQWRDINRTVQKSQDNIIRLQDQVQMLQAQLNESFEQEKQLTKTVTDWMQHNQADKVSVPLATKTPFRQIFYIKAIVPGRSWIADQWGRLQSVTLGTNLPEYGKVTSIDPTRGEVTTDSGQVITYGFNDH